MFNANFEKSAQQFDDMFLSPLRAFSALSIDYSEKLIGAQMELTKSYADASLTQARSMLEIKDSEGLKNFVKEQQETVKSLGEKLQNDTQKVVELNQEYAKKGQELAESNAKSASEAMQKVAK
ncbi:MULTISPECIES: phasin family protein [Cobetia]|uniref:phasin family protein n=1 Tax=Cobetia TaxID=204286 RepID=UPI0015830FB3|nr:MULTISPECIES: phasin family protein [Cobetia]MDH2421317.1 phasin family protein [Cobetia litoralis]MDI4659816.1 phasin family protein [Cobetia sp. BMC6]MDL2191743.1 phasin family protein [Cobetia sp. LC6]NUJ55223.1 phasin family protein [Cobetia marina]